MVNVWKETVFRLVEGSTLLSDDRLDLSELLVVIVEEEDESAECRRRKPSFSFVQQHFSENRLWYSHAFDVIGSSEMNSSDRVSKVILVETLSARDESTLWTIAVFFVCLYVITCCKNLCLVGIYVIKKVQYEEGRMSAGKQCFCTRNGASSSLRYAQSEYIVWLLFEFELRNSFDASSVLWYP